MKLTADQFNKLAELEKEVYRCGWDGGMSTSAAIDMLKEAEEELGVEPLKPHQKTPRWFVPAE